MIYVFLADGFEETEAIAPIDMLRRAKLDVKLVGIGTSTPTSSHGIRVTADLTEAETALYSSSCSPAACQEPLILRNLRLFSQQ